MFTRDNANLFCDDLPDFFGDTITIALGRNKEDRFWKNEPMPYGKLIGYLCQFQRGPKNGQCMTQGSLSSGQRLAVNESINYLMMVDVDNGMPLEMIDASLAERGLHAVVYTTHSHMKAESRVPEKKMVAYQKEKKAEKIDAALVARFLLEEKGYFPSILTDVSNYHKVQDDGVHCVIDHAPMPRYRIVFKLKTPFVFLTDDATHQERINEWKERYAGVCRALRIPYDTSCVDPSRLMYLPRIAPDALIATGASPTTTQDDVVGGHCIYVFDGRELELSEFERYVAPRGRSHDTSEFAAFTALAPQREGAREYKTTNVLTFAAKYKDFAAGTFCNENVEGDEFTRQVGEGKYEVTCPSADLHSEPDAPGMSRFFAQDAIDDNSWTMHCQGDTCKKTHGDRLAYFDLFCVAHGISDALDDRVLSYCSSWQEEQKQKKEVLTASAVQKSPDAKVQLRSLIDVEIAAATIAVPEAKLNDIYKALSMLNKAEDINYVSRSVDALHANTTIAKTIIRTAIKTFIKERKDAEKKAQTDAAVSRSVDQAEEEHVEQQNAAIPVPDNVETKKGKKLQISSRWGIDDRRRIALKRIQWTNEQRPHIFVKDGEVVRVIDVPGDADYLKFKKMEKGDWEFELMETALFVKPNAEGVPEEVPPFYECVNALMNTSTRDWPLIDYVSTVPLFGPDGQFYNADGYHPDIQVYIKANVTLLPMPDVIDDAAVEWARDKVLDAITDLPFSDVFNGDDPIDIKHGDFYDLEETDGREVHRQNFKRGRSSRAHCVALMLSPHLRAMIDGKQPAYLISKTEAGTGAGTLMDIVHIIAEGHGAIARPVSPAQEEFRKQITTALMDQKPILFLDNIAHHIDSPEFAGALTTGKWGDRLLGQNTSANIEVTSTWVLAGNGISLSRELMRRMVPIHMDANDPNPALNRDGSHFKYDPIEPHIEAERPVYLQAIHILIKNWFEKGCPKGSTHMNSFHVSTTTMCGILEAAGIDGFLGNVLAYMKTSVNDAGDDYQEAVEILWEKIGEKTFDADEAWDALRRPIPEPSGKENLCVDILGRDQSTSLRNTRGLAKTINKKFANRNYKVAEDKNVGGVNVKFVKLQEHRLVKYRLVNVTGNT